MLADASSSGTPGPVAELENPRQPETVSDNEVDDHVETTDDAVDDHVETTADEVDDHGGSGDEPGVNAVDDPPPGQRDPPRSKAWGRIFSVPRVPSDASAEPPVPKRG